MTIEKTTSLLGLCSKTEVVDPTDKIIPLSFFAYGIAYGFPDRAIKVTSPDTIDLNTYAPYGYDGKPSATTHLALEDINAKNLTHKGIVTREVFKWVPHEPNHGTVYRVFGVPVYTRQKK